MKQTAVEWLVEELRKLAHDKNHHLGLGDIRIAQGMLDDYCEQALQMEKEQIMQSYSDGLGNGIAVGQEECSFESVADEEKYYKQNYGNPQ